MPYNPGYGLPAAANTPLAGDYGHAETLKRKAPYSPDEPIDWKVCLAEVKAHLPDFLLPWGMFALVYTSAIFVNYNGGLGFLSFFLCMYTSVSLVIHSRGRVWLAMSMICIAAVGLSLVFTWYTKVEYMNEAGLIENSRWYSNVLADENPVAKKDASIMTFSQESFVDVSRSVGYQYGNLYCAAPIVTALDQNTAGYWAVGIDCCKERSYFNCGDILNTSAKGSIVVLPSSSSARSHLDKYSIAAKMAATTYGMSLMTNATFVYWMSDTSAYSKELIGNGHSFCVETILAALFVTIGCAIVFPLVGLSLSGQGAAYPYPEEVSAMRIGPDLFTRRRLEGSQLAALVKDFVGQRACWSGSVYHDYIFHVCNNHMFLGIVGCHPDHPYSRLERIYVLVVVSALIVFPLSAITLQLPTDGILPIILIAVLVTVPRNIVKYYIEKLALQDDLDMMGRAGTGRHKKAQQSRTWELTMMIIIALITILLCLLSVGWMKEILPDESVLDHLRWHCDGLAWAFVIQLVFDIILPYKAPRDLQTSSRPVWCVGFFGRWLLENDRMALQRHYESRSYFRKVEFQITQQVTSKASSFWSHLLSLDQQDPQQSTDSVPMRGFTPVGFAPPPQPGAPPPARLAWKDPQFTGYGSAI